MKKFFIIISIILCNICAYGQSIYDQHTPKITPFIVKIDDINKYIGDISGHEMLYEQYGCVTIPPTAYDHDGTSQGIIIVHNKFGDYMAFERRCPHCYYDKGEIGVFSIWSIHSAICNRCERRAEHLIVFGSGQLTDYYEDMRTGPRYLDSYKVEEHYIYNSEKRKKEHILHIESR